jgi:hypothetical protein
MAYVEHRCTSRECGRVTHFPVVGSLIPAACVDCGRAVIETFHFTDNPVRKVKQTLLERAKGWASGKVDKELDEVLGPRIDRKHPDLEAPYGGAVSDAPDVDPREVYRAALNTAFDRQEGGSHYKDFVIQPAEFIHKNGIGFLAGNVIKYVCRHREKNGAEDLRKAIHYLELLLESEYGEGRGDR